MSQHSTNRGRSPIFGQSTIIPPSPLPTILQGARAANNDVVASTQPPTKINPNFQFAAAHVPLVHCHYHPDQQIRNFCLSPACLMPLCPACVAIHQQEHERNGTKGRFETLEACLTLTYQDVAVECNKFVDDLNDAARLINDIKNSRQLHQQSVQESKQKLYQVIDAFFESLEQDLQRTSQVNSDLLLSDTQKTQQAVTNRWETLVKLLEKLNTDKCLKSLIKYHSKEIQDQCLLYHNEARQQLEHHRSQLPQLVFDQSVLYQINQSLQRLIYWNKQATQQQQTPQPQPLQPVNQIPQQFQVGNKQLPHGYHQSPNVKQPISLSAAKRFVPPTVVNLPGQVIPFTKPQPLAYYHPMQGLPYTLPPQQYMVNPFLHNQNIQMRSLSPQSPSPRLDLSFSPQLEI